MSVRETSVRRAILWLRQAEPFDAGARPRDAIPATEPRAALSGHHYRPFFRESAEPGELNPRAL